MRVMRRIAVRIACVLRNRYAYCSKYPVNASKDLMFACAPSVTGRLRELRQVVARLGRADLEERGAGRLCFGASGRGQIVCQLARLPPHQRRRLDARARQPRRQLLDEREEA